MYGDDSLPDSLQKLLGDVESPAQMPVMDLFMGNNDKFDLTPQLLENPEWTDAWHQEKSLLGPESPYTSTLFPSFGDQDTMESFF